MEDDSVVIFPVAGHEPGNGSVGEEGTNFGWVRDGGEKNVEFTSNDKVRGNETGMGGREILGLNVGNGMQPMM